jgi:hypothetical protein
LRCFDLRKLRAGSTSIEGMNGGVLCKKLSSRNKAAFLSFVEAEDIT